MKTHKGFTLIELLVVISIVSLLATVTVAALQNVRAKGRDAKRVAEVKALQQVLELYYDDNGEYPDQETLPSNVIEPTFFIHDGQFVLWDEFYTIYLSNYINKIPRDPQGPLGWPYNIYYKKGVSELPEGLHCTGNHEYTIIFASEETVFNMKPSVDGSLPYNGVKYRYCVHPD